MSIVYDNCKFCHASYFRTIINSAGGSSTLPTLVGKIKTQHSKVFRDAHKKYVEKIHLVSLIFVKNALEIESWIQLTYLLKFTFRFEFCQYAKWWFWQLGYPSVLVAK